MTADWRLRSLGRTWRGTQRGTGPAPVGLVVSLLLALTAACATKVAPPLPASLAHPDFIYPAAPQALQTDAQIERLDRAWRFLQNDRLAASDREFRSALRASPEFYPAQAGLGYVALAQREYDRAVTAFDSALSHAPAYVPALFGRGHALLALDRDDEALAALEAAARADPSLGDLRRRIEVLRFRTIQTQIAGARAAVSAGRTAEARLAYERALAATPDSAFLYRELGVLERNAGHPDAALVNFRKAVMLDASDAASLVEIGTLLEGQQDFEGAADAYRRAAAIDPDADVAEKLSRVTTMARESRMLPELRAIADAPQVTRGELAALIATRLEPLLQSAPEQRVVMTDTRGSWADAWIIAVVSRGVMEPFENHTFQPQARVRRGDLAGVVSRLVRLAAQDRPALRTVLSARPAMVDVSPAHLSYPAVAVAVASGVMPLDAGQRFQLTRPVSGAEAIQVIDRLRALVDR